MLPKLDFQSMTRKCWLAPTCRGKRCLFLQVLQQTAGALPCATPGAFPEAWQVGRYGSLRRECCRVSLRSRTARLLLSLVPGTAGWECCCTHPLLRSRTKADFVIPCFILSCSRTVTQGLGKTLLLYSSFVEKFHKFFQNSPTFSASLQSRGFTVLQNMWNEQHFLVLKC